MGLDQASQRHTSATEGHADRASCGPNAATWSENPHAMGCFPPV